MSPGATQPIGKKRAKSARLSERAKTGIRGCLLIVNDEVRSNTLPLTAEQSMELLGEIVQLSVVYSAHTELPLKVLYLAYKKSFLLVVMSRRNKVVYWADAKTNLVELEAAARQLASTAHLKSATDRHQGFGLVRGTVSEDATEENSPTHTDSSNQIDIMNWNDANLALEGIMSKVLAQAQAAKMIQRALKETEVDLDDDFDPEIFEAVGRRLLEKIPHKVLRANLTNEFNALLSRIN